MSYTIEEYLITLITTKEQITMKNQNIKDMETIKGFKVTNSDYKCKGFEFKNPNASRTCGCGESFSL